VTAYLDLVDYLLVAETVLGHPAEDIAQLDRISLAESALAAPAMSFSGVEFYPDPIMKAAVLCARLVRNHPLPDGNKRVAYLCLREFLARNGLEFHRPPVDETVGVIEALAAGELSEPDFADWLREHVTQRDEGSG
jgi:death-on-curing protein